MTPDKRVNEIVEEFQSKDHIVTADGGLYVAVDAHWLTTTLTQLVKEVEAGEKKRFINFMNEVLYTVDVDKEPSIPDEAWANQYDSKAQAFWYGEAEAIGNIKEELLKLTTPQATPPTSDEEKQVHGVIIGKE